MNINGIGIIFNRGTGIKALENALIEGWKEPVKTDIPFLNNTSLYSYQVNLRELSDAKLMQKVRRSDRFSKMALQAAFDALNDSGENIDKKNICIIVATAFGAHVTTFNFLDNIIDYGESNVSPTTFSNSVHNAAASYLSSVLEINGATLTVTQFFFSFHNAILLAKIWLDGKKYDYILVGAVDECGNVLRYIHNYKLKQPDDGKIKPFNFNPTYQIPGEGAVFFLVSNKSSKNTYCAIENVIFNSKNDYKETSDIHIIDTDGLISDESIYKSLLSSSIPAAAFSPLFGSMMIGSAFNCAISALMLKNQIAYENPVKDNPYNINILKKNQKRHIDFISCIRYNCQNKNSIIQLKNFKP